MSGTAPALPTAGRRPRNAAARQLLRSLEARLIGLDEGLLLSTAWVIPAPAEPPPAPPNPRPRLGFRRVQPPRRSPASLRFTPLPAELDQLVIQNWNPHAGYVPLGDDVDLELDPGQAVTLWIRRAAPAPVPRDAPHDEQPPGRYVLSSDERLKI